MSRVSRPTTNWMWPCCFEGWTKSTELWSNSSVRRKGPCFVWWNLAIYHRSKGIDANSDTTLKLSAMIRPLLLMMSGMQAIGLLIPFRLPKGIPEGLAKGWPSNSGKEIAPLCKNRKYRKCRKNIIICSIWTAFSIWTIDKRLKRKFKRNKQSMKLYINILKLQEKLGIWNWNLIC